MQRIIARKKIITVGELRSTLESFILQHPDEVLLEDSKGNAPFFELVEETLTDGSKVLNARIV